MSTSVNSVEPVNSDPAASALALPPSVIEPRAVSSPAGGIALEVEVASPCDRTSLLDFELELSGSGRGQRLIGRDRVQWHGLVAGDYNMRISGTGWKPHRETIHLTGVSPHKLIVELEPVRFIRGRVVAKTGTAAVRRFSLQIETRRWTSEGHEETLRDWIRDYESDDGSFCIGGIRQHGSELRVIASAVGFEDGETDWLPVNPTDAVSDLVIMLAPTAEVIATITGEIVDAETGRPIEGADVLFAPPDVGVQRAWLASGKMQIVDLRFSEEIERRPTRNRARSASNGTFSIETSVGREGKLLAYHVEYQLGESAPFDAGTTNPFMQMKLTRGTTLHGIVRVLEESPFHVDQIEIEGPSRHEFVTLSAEGRFDVHGLTKGIYSVCILGVEGDGRVRTNPRLLSRTRVVVANEQVLEIEIALGLGVTGGTIEGTVEAPDEPWDAERIVGTAYEQGNLEAEQVRSVAADGSFRLTEVSPGPHWVLTTYRSTDRSLWGVAAKRIDVQEGRTHDTVVLDMRGSRVAGTYRRSGQPGSHVRIELVTQPEERNSLAAFVGSALSIKSDGDGQFVIYGLPPGMYHFRAEASSRIASVEILNDQTDYALLIEDR